MQEVKAHLTKRGFEYKDFGCYGTEAVDYPEFGRAAAEAVASGECEYGIVICGTGIGISITANKVPGIRCALCTDCFMAHKFHFLADYFLRNTSTTPYLRNITAKTYFSLHRNTIIPKEQYGEF